MKKAYAYDDILLVPQFSQATSRANIDTSTDLGGGVCLDVPIISSPMDTISCPTFINEVAAHGGLGILHRFYANDHEFTLDLKQIHQTHIDNHRIGVALGLKDYSERIIKAKEEKNIHIFCIDVAHGDHQEVVRVIKDIKEIYGHEVYVIVGNVATMVGFGRLCYAGADAIRVGIGGGSMCTTRQVTGHGVPTATSVAWADEGRKRYGYRAKIIADGGIRTYGDVVKALALGADAVMCGWLFARCVEASGGGDVFRGMASKGVQRMWRDEYRVAEGVETTFEDDGKKTSVSEVMRDVRGALQSGLSYSGADSIDELQQIAEFVEISSAGYIEGSPHGL